MKKKFISSLLALSIICGAFVTSASAVFSDISDPNTALAASVLQSMGVVDGVGDGRFDPDSVLTRAQFCTLVVRMMGLEDKASANSYKLLFSDVKPGVWYTGYVNLAYGEGLVQGYGNGKFGPDDGVTYGQVATILLRMLGYSEAEIGRVWPTDYTAFAHELELDEGLTLDAFGSVTRGQTAALLYTTLGTEINGSAAEYYTAISGVAAAQTAIILDTDAVSGGVSGQLMVCAVTAAGAEVEYFTQKNKVPADLTGCIGELLLDSGGKVVGFMPSSDEFRDVTVASAKVSGITDASGSVFRVSGGATVIAGGELYTWNKTGYIQINAQTGKNARLYYDDDGAVCYVYLATGTTGAGTAVAVAETGSAASELARKLGVVGSYSITKNGSPAAASDLAQNDVAYFDGATRTLCASDYRVSGCIEAASPSVDGAQTLTVAGHEFEVLESAWESLSARSLGSSVTLLLTDDCKVASCASASAAMAGVLSTDGASVSLCGSGVVLTAGKVSAPESLRGRLVKVTQPERGELSCTAFSSAGSSAKLDISAETLGSREIAPACAVYEQAVGVGASYVYSLSGVPGAASPDFSDIYWTTSLPASAVGGYHLNSAGKVDIILLNDVTGNCYSYGKLTSYSENEGVNVSTVITMPAWNSAVTLTNGALGGQSPKYLCGYEYASVRYAGVALRTYNSVCQEAAAVTALTGAGSCAADSFFRSDGDWFVSAGGFELPVGDGVQVYIAGTEQWLSGESGLLTALATGLEMSVYYDRTPSTGAQARVITVQSAQ